MVILTQYDRDKIIDCMFDPTTAGIIAELENGQRKSTELAEVNQITVDEVDRKLSYLVDCGFVSKGKDSDGDTTYSANVEQLTRFVEDDDNFDSAIDGLTKMDSYLN